MGTDNEEHAMNEALTRVAEIDKKRRERLEEREQQLKRERAAFEEEKKAFGAGNNGRASDVLHLNVGGKRMDVLRRTLTQVDGSLLASMFSGQWDDSLQKDRDGNIFIDQPWDLFEALVDFLRCKQNEVDGVPPVDPPSEKHFENFSRFHRFFIMVHHYGLGHEVFPITLEQLDGENQHNESYRFPGMELSCDSFRLMRAFGTYPIGSIEVLLGSDVTDFQIGCIHPEFGRKGNPPPRIGRYCKSLGFDVVKFEKLYNGQIEKFSQAGFGIDGRNIAVRWEWNPLACFVNGRKVFTVDPSHHIYNFDDLDTAISGTGTWKILCIKYSPDIAEEASSSR